MTPQENPGGWPDALDVEAVASWPSRGGIMECRAASMLHAFLAERASVAALVEAARVEGFKDGVEEMKDAAACASAMHASRYLGADWERERSTCVAITDRILALPLPSTTTQRAGGQP